MAHVMTIKFSDTCSVEVSVLNPGQGFKGFGGSSGTLVAKKTASIITRTKNHGWSDVEMDIYDRQFWAWLAGLINTGTDKGVVATMVE